MTLTACGGVPKPSPIAPDPVVEARIQTRLICPPELWRALPFGEAGPTPAAGAVVQHNDPGGDWIDALIDQAASAVAIILGARKACDESEAAPL